ncbi:unnamed protein product [Choristocarpus tenellus]
MTNTQDTGSMTCTPCSTVFGERPNHPSLTDRRGKEEEQEDRIFLIPSPNMSESSQNEPDALRSIRNTFRNNVLVLNREHEETLMHRTKEMDALWEALQIEREVLTRRQQALGVKEIVGNKNDLVRLNVGGVPIPVLRSILTQEKGSRLGALFEVKWEKRIPRDRNGSIFLDESPSAFFRILELLLAKSSGTPPPDMVKGDENKLIMHLAEFFGTARVDPTGQIAGGSDIIPSNQETEYLEVIKGWCPDSLGKLHLLYRGTRDGLTPSDFHRTCGSSCPTLTLVHCGEAIVGGFSNQPWNGNGWSSSSEAFLFSLRDKLGNKIMSKLEINLNEQHRAVFCYRNCGPYFGTGGCLYVNLEANRGFLQSNLTRTYDSSGPAARVLSELSGHQPLTEVEVFLVTNASTFSTESERDLPPTQIVGCSREEDHRVLCAPIARELWLEQAALDGSRTQLDKERATLEMANKSLVSLFGRDLVVNGDAQEADCIVDLNVRGNFMSTLRSTLCLCSESALAARFRNKLWKDDMDDHGRHIIDCCPLSFMKILDVLRIRKKEIVTPKVEGVVKTSALVNISVNMMPTFEEIVNLYFPGSEGFIMDLVEVVII